MVMSYSIGWKEWNQTKWKETKQNKENKKERQKETQCPKPVAGKHSCTWCSNLCSISNC